MTTEYYNDLVFEGLRFVSETALSGKEELDNINPSTRYQIKDLASYILNPNKGYAAVVGDSQAGKSFIIEQLNYNISQFTKEKISFVTLNSSNTLGLENHVAGYKKFVETIAESLDLETNQICFVTENAIIAHMLFMSNPEVKIILEANVSTYSLLMQQEMRGETKVWSSWPVINVSAVEETTMKEVIATLQKLFDNSCASEAIFNKRNITNFVNSFKAKEVLSYTKDSKDISLIPVGLWVSALNYAQNYIEYSKEQFLYGKEKIDYSELWEKTWDLVSPTFIKVSTVNLSKVKLHSTKSIIQDHYRQSAESQKEYASVAGSDQPAVIKKNNDSNVSINSFVSPETLTKKLNEKILGQENAINEIIDTLRIPMIGLNDPNKPIASFLFLGPTGVGKTEIVLNLAKNLKKEPLNVVRIDMSEYSQEHEVAKIIGAPPGYVGSDDGGFLTNEILKNPESIILLDEAEKAHPKVWQTFLQVLDAGRLTDSRGKVVDFTKTIIVLTSNLGISEASKPNLGFTSLTEADLYARRAENAAHIIDNSVKNYFAPEFLNRLDKTIIFNEIKRDIIDKIVLKEIAAHQDRIEKKHGIILNDVSEDIIEKIVELSDVTKYGAREIKRRVSNELLVTVARMLSNLNNNEKEKVSNIELYLNDGVVMARSS